MSIFLGISLYSIIFCYIILYNILLFQLLKGILHNVHHPSFFFFVRVNTYDCGEKISNWLSKFFGRPYHLIKQSSDFQRNAKKKHGKGITFGLLLRGQELGLSRHEHQSTKWVDRVICSWSGGGRPWADRCWGDPAGQQGHVWSSDWPWGDRRACRLRSSSLPQSCMFRKMGSFFFFF